MGSKPEFAHVLLNGKKIHIDVYPNTADMPVILFIPGMGCYAGLYAEFLGALADSGFTVIGIDPPGLGRSDGPRGRFEFHEVVDCVSVIISHAAARFSERIGVLGSSLGGTYALYATLNESRIKSTFCHGAMDISQDLHIPTRFPAIVQFLVRYFRGAARIISKLPVPLKVLVNWNHVVESQNLLRSIKNDPLMVWYYSMGSWISFVDYRPGKEFKELSTPLTIVTGESDLLFPPSHCAKLAEKISSQGALLQIVPGGHFLPMEYLPAFLPVVVGWFAKTL